MDFPAKGLYDDQAGNGWSFARGVEDDELYTTTELLLGSRKGRGDDW